MRLVDANVLLYAVNRDSRRHDVARAWLDQALSGGSPVGFAWVALLAFLRLSTRRSLFPQPLPVPDALGLVEDWLAAPSAALLHPSSRHTSVLANLLRTAGSGGNLVNDAHLAALAIEHRARIVTFDTDFARFANVRWEEPTTPATT